MDKYFSNYKPSRASVAKFKGVGFLKNLSFHLILICIGGGIGSVILRLSPTTALVTTASTLIIWLFVKNLLVPFYFAALCVLALQEVEITPGSFLCIFENVKNPGIPSLLEASVVLLAACFLVKYILNRDAGWFPVFTIPVILFGIFYCISLCIGINSGNNNIFIKEDSKKFFFPIIFFICSINILSTKKRIHCFVNFVLVVVSVKAYLGIFSYLRGVGFDYGDARVIFIETADLILVVTVLVSIAARIIFGKFTGKSLLVFCVVGAPLLFSLVYSNRRNAWLGILLAFCMLFCLAPTKTKPRMVAILLGAALVGGSMVNSAVLLLGLPTGNDLKSRFASISDKEDKSNEAHINEWVVTIEALKEHPVLGLGFGSEHASVPGDDTINRHTVHNAFLMLYMKMGVHALLLFLWSMYRYFSFCARRRGISSEENLGWLKLGLFSTFAYWLVTLNVAPSWWYYREMCMMGLVMAIAIRLSLLSDSADQSLANQQAVVE